MRAFAALCLWLYAWPMHLGLTGAASTAPQPAGHHSTHALVNVQLGLVLWHAQCLPRSHQHLVTYLQHHTGMRHWWVCHR